MGVQVFVCDVRDDVAPFLADAAGLVFVVDDGGCEGAGDGEEDEPVAGGEADSREA